MTPVRRLYFDIDGTILIQATGEPKPVLADGHLEAAIRSAAFDELVCVANLVAVVHTMREMDAGYDGLGAILAVCQGAFQDEAWFRQVTSLARDPRNRALEVSRTSDWWYMDDLARDYMSHAGLSSVFEAEDGHRILVPSTDGDGADVVGWLQRWTAGDK